MSVGIGYTHVRVGQTARPFGTSAEMSRPNDRIVRNCGPNCVGIRTEMSQCQNVLLPRCPRTLGHWCQSVSSPSCLGSDVGKILILDLQQNSGKTAENVLKLILLLIKSGFVERKCVILLLCCVIW